MLGSSRHFIGDVAATERIVRLYRVTAAVCRDDPKMTMGKGGHTGEWDRDRELEGVLRGGVNRDLTITEYTLSGFG